MVLFLPKVAVKTQKLGAGEPERRLTSPWSTFTGIFEASTLSRGNALHSISQRSDRSEFFDIYTVAKKRQLLLNLLGS